ncbi:hypothetical protein NEHOM01_1095 [Nematocida homosporus]|uniref:uncharacterized protein n=1 Tax=Nematocida homosporus TaxID=1912981 RepID=UPI00222029D8|nr:uncharacterized protein NEHOM01_1095 [Nematocida homosporus]KAI5185818.1 hypothetical protein NEHOM01_1095 [Nematocida homosporus]
MYIGLYTHDNELVYESNSMGMERILAYAATDILDKIVGRSNYSLFSEIVRYEGRSVNGVVLANGYKGFMVYGEGEGISQEEMNEVIMGLKNKILARDYDEVVLR